LNERKADESARPAPPVTTAERPVIPSVEEARKRDWRGLAIAVVSLTIALFLFVLAIQMMKTGAAALAPRLQVTRWNALATLGLGTLLAYLFLSGKPVTAFALALFTANGLTKLQTFTMISGGRLGAAFIVLLIGFLYAVRGSNRRDSLGVGVLALLLTASVYIPAMMVGYGLLKSGALNGIHLTSAPLQRTIDVVYGPIVDKMAAVLPDPLLLPLGGALIVLALKVLDRVVPEVDGSNRVESDGGGIRGRWPMFFMGLGITLVTISVSVALTLLVPLTAKGQITRRQAVPYIMGANVATMIDNLIISVVYGNPVGVQIVLAEFFAVAFVTAVLLAFLYQPLSRSVIAVDEWVVDQGWHLTLFVAVIFILPVLMIALGFLLGPSTPPT
jgi:solute carrier family 34 (sodium-dependent phosphate cotransporter)